MTAVPPRPAADTRCTCGGTWPCTGPAWMGDHSPERITSADGVVAPDATAGDGLREAELVARLAEAIQDHRDAATGPTTPEQDYRPGAPCRSCGDYPGPLHERSDCPRAVARALLPALRDVLAAAARDAEKVRRVEELLPRIEGVIEFDMAGERYDAVMSVQQVRDHLIAALNGTQ